MVFALLALALNAALWWVYFSDETAVEEAFHDRAPERRPQLALQAFGYWHYGLLLAVIAVAAGLKKAIGHPYEQLDDWVAVALGAGTALYIVCDAGFRRARSASPATRSGSPPRGRAGHDPARHRGGRRRAGRRAGGSRGRRLGRSGTGGGIPSNGRRRAAS